MSQLIQVPRAPAIVVRSKVREGPLEEDRAFQAAVDAARCITVPLPVIFRGRHLGWVMGERAPSPYVWWMREPQRLAPFTSYADLLSERGLNKRSSAAWRKQGSTSHVGANWYDTWPIDGVPAAGAYGGSAFTAKQHSDAEAGALWLGGNVSAQTKHVVSAWGMSADSACLLFYDRVLTYEACTLNANSEQGFTNSLAAQRYIASGEPGLQICATCETALGASASNITQLEYTDNEGNADQSMPTGATVSVIVSAAAPTSSLGARVVAPADSGGDRTWGPFLPLAVGDTGVRLIDNWVTSVANTGTLCFVLCYPIAMVPVLTYSISTYEDEIMMRNRLPRLYDGACVSVLTRINGTGGRNSEGGMEVAWG